jgi:hypothetical protein
MDQLRSVLSEFTLTQAALWGVVMFDQPCKLLSESQAAPSVNPEWIVPPWTHDTLHRALRGAISTTLIGVTDLFTLAFQADRVHNVIDQAEFVEGFVPALDAVCPPVHIIGRAIGVYSRCVIDAAESAGVFDDLVDVMPYLALLPEGKTAAERAIAIATRLIDPDNLVVHNDRAAGISPRLLTEIGASLVFFRLQDGHVCR